MLELAIAEKYEGREDEKNDWASLKAEQNFCMRSRAARKMNHIQRESQMTRTADLDKESAENGENKSI